jgi:glucokinase
MNAQCVIAGVDIGGTNTVVGIIDDHGTCLLKTSFPTAGHRHAEEFVKRLATAIRELCREVPGESELRGIGIAAPAANYRLGTIQNPANLQWKTVEIVDMMKQYFAVPIKVTNDANAAAIGEMKYGSAQGMKNFIVLTLGTGLGAGIVMDGQVLYGENGVAGELGHVIVEPDGRVCGCRRRGCVETYVSATGIRRTVFELLADSITESELREISFSSLSSEKIYELAIQGDPIAREAFQITGKHLGLMLSNIVAAFDPEAIVLSGGLMHAGDLLLEPTRKSFEENALQLERGKVVILKSSLQDGDAAILGASCIVGDGGAKEHEPSLPAEGSLR